LDKAFLLSNPFLELISKLIGLESVLVYFYFLVRAEF